MAALTLTTVRAMLRNECPDIVIRKNDCGEYRVTFSQTAIQSAYPAMSRQEAIEKAESLAAHESDIESAYETALAIARVGFVLAVEPATVNLLGVNVTRQPSIVTVYHATGDAIGWTTAIRYFDGSEDCAIKGLTRDQARAIAYEYAARINAVPGWFGCDIVESSK